jgi:hypothetical protein
MSPGRRFTLEVTATIRQGASLADDHESQSSPRDVTRQ